MAKSIRTRTHALGLTVSGLVLAAWAGSAWAQQGEIINGVNVTIDGSGDGTNGTYPSPWIVEEYLGVGGDQGGSLTIMAGGRVSIDHPYGAVAIGFDPSVEASALVTGAGSIWTARSFYVGFTGNGMLTIEDGGTVTSSHGEIGQESGSEGMVLVTGAGSVWVTDNLLEVGHEGVGTLTIAEGGWVISMLSTIGYQPGSVGTVVVTGADSTWSSTSHLRVGDLGTGTLTIEDGGSVANENGLIAHSSGSVGAVEVAGTGSSWVNRADLYVGNYGTGELTISDGGTVTNAVGYIGYFAGSSGRATVSGADSTWVSNQPLYVGMNGTGTLSIEDGGSVTSLSGAIGRLAGSEGTVLVTGVGSTWTNSGGLPIGNEGTGTLTIEDGGSVTNTYGIVGHHPGSEGTVLVTGLGSTWANSESLLIGNEGTGTLTIEDGSSVTNSIGSIGFATTSNGTVLVTGTGSTWASREHLDVGTWGIGSLFISEGGSVTNTSGSIGADSGSGIVEVSGAGSIWVNSGDLYIGREGTGTLTIEDGGKVSNHWGLVGWESGAMGTVSVTGAGSSLASSAYLYVGGYGTGVLTVADGGVVAAGDGSGGPGYVFLGAFSGAAGALNIGAAPGDAATGAGILDAALLEFGEGSGTLNFNHTGTTTFAADLVSAGSGTHTLNHLSGTTTLTGDSSGFQGSTSVTGGTLVVANALGGSTSVTGGSLVVDGTLGGDVVAYIGGTVSGAGTIAGNADFTDADFGEGGILAGIQGQTLRIDGNVTIDESSVVSVALGGASTAALFDVGGDLTLAGTLDVSDQGGFGVGVYRIFDYAGMLSGDGLVIGDTPAGINPGDLSIQTAVANEVNLISSAGAILSFWDGGDTALHDNGAVNGGSGVWRADGRNWTRADGALNGRFNPNPTFAVFQGTAGTVNVDASAGAIGVRGMQFAADGYRIEGDAIALQGSDGESIIRVGDGTEAGASITATIASELTGDTALVKSDRGTLILTGQNSYTGGTTLTDGVLSISRDANLGDAAGGLTFTYNAGALVTTASFDSGRTIRLDAAGRFDVASGTTLGLEGEITGPSDLVKRGDGTLVLSGSNAYGNTLVENGTLVGDSGSISGNIGNAATVVFDQGADASFAGTIGGLGGTNGVMVKRGTGALTLAGASGLDWTVEAGGLVSAAERFAGDVAISTDGAFTFHQDNDGAYDGVISGAGDLAVAGSGSVLLTGDSSGFAGATTVTGGTLLVGDTDGNGTLGGSLDVLSGGTLGGSGTVGSGAGSLVTVASGGTLAPGNTIGTLTVDGDLTFEAGSRLAIEVDPQGSDSDLVAVTGNATFNGGVVAHIGATGNYELRSTYTILSAEGTLVGAFDDVTSDFAFLTPELIYDYGAGTVDLELARNDMDFASAALTRNQIATANGIDSIGVGAGHAVYDAIAQLADDGDLIRASFDALSGEIHASAKTALIEDSRFIRNAANDRIRAAFGAAGASHAPILAYGPGDTPMAVAADHAGPVFWSHGFGSWGSTDSDGNGASLDHSVGGLLIGTDGHAGDWRIGLLAGYSHSTFDADDRASSGSSDNYHLGLYGGTQWNNVALRSGLAYSWHDIETSRSVSIPGLSDRLTGDYSAGTFQAFGELGYGMEAGAVRFEPFANLAHVSLYRESFTEQGGEAALSGSSGTTDVTFTTLGLRAERSLSFGGTKATLRGMVGWRHAFGDVTPESTHAFSAGNAFTIAGVPIARNSAIIEAGVDLSLTDTATLGFAYQGQIASEAQDHGLKANLKIGF